MNLPKEKILNQIRIFLKHRNKLILAGSVIVFTGISWFIIQYFLGKGGFNTSSYTTEVPNGSPSLYIAGNQRNSLSITSPSVPPDNSNNVAGVSTESSYSPSPSPKPSPSPSPTPTPTPSPTLTPTPTPTPSPTLTPTPDPTPTPTETPTPTPDPSPSPSPIPSPSPTPTPSPSPSENPSPSP